MTDSEWAAGETAQTFTTTRKGVLYHPELVEDGVLPAGWRLWREGARRWRPVAAQGRPMWSVWQQATGMLDTGSVR